jgi:type I restriction enzyme S subunit
VLATLDAKIELNRRMNATLEAMAQALFKSWFVGFDPVKAKVKELVGDGILEIGDGYRAKNDELGEPGLPFIRAANLNNGFDTESAERLREGSVARAGTKISRVGDVAFTSKGTIGRFARVGEATERFVYSPQVCFWRSLDKAQLHPAVLYCWMQTDEFKAQVLAVAGQTDMAPYVSLRDQREMLAPRFPSTQAEVGAKIEPLLVRQSLNNAESRTLAALRDALLPRLISGQLRIPEAEKLAEAM